MPTYEYEREDGTRFEISQKITEDALELCPETGQKVKRLISGGNFHLKGSGWYKTDYGSSGSAGTESSSNSTAKSSDKGGSSGGGCGSGGCGCD